MHVPFLSLSGHKRLGGHLLHTTMNLCRSLGQKFGGMLAVGVFLAIYGGAAVADEIMNNHFGV